MISKQLEKKSVRFLLIFIISIFVLTFVSRITNGLTIPKVAVVSLKRETLIDDMNFEGRVSKADTSPIFTVEGQKIEKIYVHLNQEVSIETPLFKLDMAGLEKEISRLNYEIEKVELSIQNIENQDAYNQNNQALKIRQALDHYNAIKDTDADKSAKQEAYNAWQIAKSETPLSSLDDEAYLLDKNKLVEEKAVLEQIKSANGEIKASRAGFVTQIDTSQGKLTTQEAILFISSKDSDNILKFQTEKVNQEYLERGQIVGVTGTSSQDVKIEMDKAAVVETSINQENQELIDVKVNLLKEDFKYGSNAQVIAVKNSASYPKCLPTSAIHEEGAGYYVFVAKTKKTMLGDEIIAEKVKVDLIDKTINFTAIEENKLLDGRDILLEINQNIQEKSKVRIVNSYEK